MGAVAILVQASHVKASRCLSRLSHIMSWRQGVEYWGLQPDDPRRDGLQPDDPRRDYSFGNPGARLGKLWISDWDSAHSPWADQFDLIINCSHKEGKYRRCHVAPDPHP